jgi:hypothetical protein
MIQEVDEDSLERFFAQAQLSAHKLYEKDQARLIASAAWEGAGDLMEAVSKDEGLDDMDRLLSVFVYAFQLGREYELFRVKESLRRGR